ncbi:DNA topoisomerase 3-alpha [Coemansia sp. RSA 552]|nr:DNA topoisomerase 3-alpha [Coemansia sp. RSA 552]
MRILCVAEKPSQAKAVVQILGQGQHGARRGRSRYNMNYDFQYRVGGTFVEATMTSVAGHVTEIDFPQNMRRWQSCNPVALFGAPIVETVSDNSKDVARNLESEAQTATHLYVWTDCDREGEGIGNEIAEICRKVNARIVVKRAHFSSVLPQEIHQAMQNPRDLDMRLVSAVQARTELDLRIGSALTRFQTLRLQSRFAAVQDKLISYGPCQFPTLGFVVDQFQRVENFVPETFWYIFLDHAKDDGKATFAWRRQRLFDQEACFALYALCMRAPQARIVSVRSRPQEKWRPLPLTTVELQKCCARFLRLSTDKIMSIAETLYNQGFVSYPRTETDQFDRNMGLSELVARLTQYQPFSAYAQKLVDGEFRWPRQGRNNDKAHPPIHPVAPANNLSGDQKRVYEFITRRFLACCSENAKGQATEVEVEVAQERFHTKGLMIIARNYLDIYPYDRWAESTVPVYTQGDVFEPTTLEMRTGTTTAPRLLTEADLVDAMEKNGIGTDATHADHIKKILDREYIFKSREGFLSPSTLGIGLVEGYDAIGLELSLSKPYLRREMERELKRICDGVKTKDEVISESVNLYRAVYTRSVEQVELLEQALSRFLDEQPTDGPGNANGVVWTPDALPDAAAGLDVCQCPMCRNGSLTLRVRANNAGWMVGCNLYPNCKHVIWIPVSVVASVSVSDTECPTCRNASTRLLDIRFKPGAAPPGVPSPYRGCIMGCDELISELFGSRSSGAPSRPPPQSNGSRHIGSLQLQSSGDGSAVASFQQPQQRPPPMPSMPNGNGGGPADAAPPCECGILSVRRVTTKEGPNKGRPFFVCSKPPGVRCDFFQWADQPASAAGAPVASGSGTNGFSGQFRSSSPSVAGNSPYSQHFDSAPVTKPKCQCGLYAALRTKNSAGENQGKEYYFCTREFQGCGFVCWKDDVEAYISGALTRTPAAATSSPCYRCGQVGHWSRDCPDGTGGSGSNDTGFSYSQAPQRPPSAAGGGPARRGRGRGRSSSSSSTRSRRGRGRGRGRGSSSRGRGRSSPSPSAFTDPDPDFGFW